jgi:hypothetical protein
MISWKIWRKRTPGRHEKEPGRTAEDELAEAEDYLEKIREPEEA